MIVKDTFELRKSRTLKLFYTGGDFAINSTGDALYCTCGNIVKVLSVEDGSEKFVIGNVDEECRISSFVLTEDDSEIIVAYTNDIIRRYSLLSADNSATLMHQFRATHTAPIQILKLVHKDGALILATGGADHLVKVWNLTRRQCTHNFRGGKSVVSALCFVNGGQRLAAGFAEGPIHMFDLSGDESPVAEQRFLRLHAHNSRITSLVELTNGGGRAVVLVAFGCDGQASVLNPATLERVNSFPVDEVVEDAVALAGHELDGLLTVGERGTIAVWSLKSLGRLREAKVSRSQLDGVCYCPRTNTIVCASAELDVYLVDGKSLAVSKQFSGFNDEIYDSCFISARTNCLAVASNAPDFRIYSLKSYCCHLVEGHTESVLSLSSPDWDDFLLATGSKDNSVGIWRILPTFSPEKLQQKSESRPFVQRIGIGTGHTNSVTCVRFSHAKKNPFLLSVSADGTLKIWALEDELLNDVEETEKLTLKQTFVAHSKDVNNVDVSDNDRLCVTASMDKTAKLWHIDPKTLTLGIAGTLSGHKRGVWAAKFAKTKQIVATCSGDCTIKIFSLFDKTCIQTLSGHSFAVLSLIFVDDGGRLLSADGGGLLKVWDLDSGVCDKTLEAHTDKIWSIGVIPPTEEALDDNTALIKAQQPQQKANLTDGNAESGSKLVRYVTVSSDSEVNFWEDVSELVKTERIMEESKRLAEMQTLQNFVEQEKFVDALLLTIDLTQPFQCLKVVRKILEQADGGQSEFRVAFDKMAPAQISALLEYASQWNTNTRHCLISQTLLNYALRKIPLDEFLKLPNADGLVKAFLAYSNRHYDRLYDLRTNVSHLDYVFAKMRID